MSVTLRKSMDSPKGFGAKGGCGEGERCVAGTIGVEAMHRTSTNVDGCIPSSAVLLEHALKMDTSAIIYQRHRGVDAGGVVWNDNQLPASFASFIDRPALALFVFRNNCRFPSCSRR